MIDVKDAVKIAADYLKNVFYNEALKDLRVEEVELSDDDRYWYITFGFSREVNEKIGPKTTFDDLQNVIKHRKYLERVYKKVTVNAESGKATSIKIRLV